MRFNRRITTIKAISFDLDDTLYSNRQVMVDTDIAMQHYFKSLAAKYQFNSSKLFSVDLNTAQYDHHFWAYFRQQALAENPALSHDVTQARYETYRIGFSVLGVPENMIQQEVELAMAHFLSHRNKVNVPDNIHTFLAALAKHYPIVAISNGNVDTKAIGLADYFDYIFHAGNGQKQKPAVDLFHQAAAQLNMKPQYVLHVGDCGNADIVGANRAGCQSAWLNCYDVGQPIKHLADIELTQVTDLANLLLPVSKK